MKQNLDVQFACGFFVTMVIMLEKCASIIQAVFHHPHMWKYLENLRVMSAWSLWDVMTQLMKSFQRRHAAIHSSTSIPMSHLTFAHITLNINFHPHISHVTPSNVFSTSLLICVSMSIVRVLIRFRLHQSKTAVSNSLRFYDRNIHPHPVE